MMLGDKQRTTADTVLTAIRTKGLRMRPKWHFVLQALLVGIGIVIVLVALVYMASLAIFAHRMNGGWYAPGYSLRGVRIFLLTAPWLLIGITLIFLVVLETLVRRYSFAYRRPLLYSVVGIVTLVGIGGIMAVDLGFHRRMITVANERDLPVIGPMYRVIDIDEPAEVHRGMVVITREQGFDLANRRGETIFVTVMPSTRLAPGWVPSLGDHVIVFGTLDDGAVIAEGVRLIEDREGLPPPDPAGMRRPGPFRGR